MKRALGALCVLMLLAGSRASDGLFVNQSPPPRTRGGTPDTEPILPDIDATRKAALRELLLEGEAAPYHNRGNVFAKVGDSITASASFLDDVGCGATTYGDSAGTTSDELEPIVDFFSARSVPGHGAWCDRPSSFTRASSAAVPGWTTASALDPAAVSCAAPYDAPVKCELSQLRPAFVIIMLGTNDLGRINDVAVFKANLTTIVRQAIQAKVIPVLSTIPPRLDSSEYASRVAAYNQAIIELVHSTDPELKDRVLLVNYWRALQGPNMLNQGMSHDGVHPSTYVKANAANFTPAGLRYGYNQRNLTWVQTLEKLKRIVLDDGAPDASPSVAP